MAARETSKLALHEIIQSGALGEMQKMVYESLYRLGKPSSASELFNYLEKSLRNPTHSNITTRLGELRDMGAVKEVGKKSCRITGRKVIAWKVTGSMPVKLPKKKTKKEKKETIVRMLRDFYKQDYVGERSKVYIKRIANEVKGL